MENKKNIVIGILVVLLLCVVGLCIYLVVDKSNSGVDNEKEQTENKVKELNINDELVQNLYKKIDVFNNPLFEDYFGYIFKEKLTYSDIENDVKLYMALASIDFYSNDYKNSDDFGTYSHIPTFEIEKSLRDIFGNIDFNHETFNGLCGDNNITYDSKNSEYVGNFNCGHTIGEPKIGTKLIKAIKNDKDIELYQSMFYKEDSMANGDIYNRQNGTVVGTTEFPMEETNGVKHPPSLGSDDKHYEDKILDMYKDKLDTYKYTFKYNEEDDKYYFYSVERIQK